MDFPRTAQLAPGLPRVSRLGLATRGNTHLKPEDVEYAVERGLNYLNWCGRSDGMSRAVAGMGERRRNLVVAAQFKARGAEEAKREFDWILAQLNTDYLDAATLYYVESEAEWDEIVSDEGAWRVLADLQAQGALKLIGLTSHQRELAAELASRRISENARESPGGSPAKEPGNGRYYLDMLMIRYNAAHRGAEQQVFPVTMERGMPAVTFTGLRWCDLLKPTPEDPAGAEPPSAADCYRFCLEHPGVAVALTAPGDRAELEENLTLLDDWSALGEEAYAAIRAHGDRVRGTARRFW